TIVNFAIGKTMLSFFNLMHAFFFVSFSIVLLIEGYDPLHVVFWHVGMAALIYCNNFLNIILNNKDGLFIAFIAIILLFGGLQYYELFDVTKITSVFYHGLFATGYMFAIALILLAVLW